MNFLQRFNDWAVRALSHPMVVALWWIASAAAITASAIHPNEVTATLALSFLALAYGSAIAEKQLREEGIEHERDCAMHAKLDALVLATAGAPDEVAASEPS